MLGAGLQPAGTTPGGFGAPTQTGLPSATVLPDTMNGGSFGSRQIDPVKGDYVLTPDGRLAGMNNIQQLVQLAVTNAGPQLQELQKLDSGFEQAVTAILTGAVASIVSQGFIDVIGVSTRTGVAGDLQPGQAVTVFKWRDRTTNQEVETPL